MMRHPWWQRKQSVCVIICPCRLLCILSDSSLLKQANSVEDCQACCGEIIILVVIYNKLSSASSTFFGMKKSRTVCFLCSIEMFYEKRCRQNLEALFTCIWRNTFDEHSPVCSKNCSTLLEKPQNYQLLENKTCKGNYMDRHDRATIP